MKKKNKNIFCCIFFSSKSLSSIKHKQLLAHSTHKCNTRQNVKLANKNTNKNIIRQFFIILSYAYTYIVLFYFVILLSIFKLFVIFSRRILLKMHKTWKKMSVVNFFFLILDVS